MYDLRVDNVKLEGVQQAVDIGILEGVITDIAPSGSLVQTAKTLIDGHGLMVLPPYIEPHIHLDSGLLETTFCHALAKHYSGWLPKERFTFGRMWMLRIRNSSHYKHYLNFGNVLNRTLRCKLLLFPRKGRIPIKTAGAWPCSKRQFKWGRTLWVPSRTTNIHVNTGSNRWMPASRSPN